ncbi:D-2-hydroxyacid dehydrogenase [Thalassotalea sp. G2M2-11]|uniref:D-2-hydroxyacid dehydrogenase n=1 Tax=Thalassotalea sp. G2M2-11 TaxID=2787627 RepID=UPI0019CFDC38|nr:D-2-hydroxyacid dehydrogenase [Thalassotalea sp. G2M2-11]
MNNLLIISEQAAQYEKLITAQTLPDLNIHLAQDTEQAKDVINDVNIILGQPALIAPLLKYASKLQWVQSTFAGVEALCQPKLRTDYCLTGVKAVLGPLMSEYVFTYILALERHIFTTQKHQHNQLWHSLPYRSLTGLTIGICGLGSIGQAIAKTAAHFQMKVLGLSRTAKPMQYIDKVYSPDNICELAQQVDYLITVLPHTKHTQHMINEKVLQALGSNGVLMNVGRGAIIDEQALIESLRNKQIRGAVLDVFQTEPLPNDSPFWTLDNVLITPHNAAVSFPEDIYKIFCDNYLRFTQQQPLEYLINFDDGY